MILKVHEINPQKRHVQRIAEIIKDGGLIVYPTDTTYSFGLDIFSKKAIETVMAIKKLPGDKLLSLACSDLRHVSQYAHLTNTGYTVMKRALPGPYTFVLQATKLVPRLMMTKRKTIGIRVPDNIIARAIIEEVGHPIITTSVKLPDEEVMTEPYEIEERLGHIVEAVVDAGIIIPNFSTIVDLSTDVPQILREGKGEVNFLDELE